MARTFYKRPAGAPGTAIQGGYADHLNVAITNDSTTTAEIDKRGYSHGCIENATGSAITITWYACMSKGGTARPYYEDGMLVALTTVIAADDIIMELPPALAGVPFLVPVSNGTTDTISIHLER